MKTGVADFMRLALIACSVAGAAAATSFDGAKPSTLREVFTMYAEACAAVSERDQIVDFARQAYTVEATWTGDLRPIQPKSLDLLVAFGDALRKRADMRALFQTEVRVSDGSDTYWLPIQEPLLSDFKSELAGGGKATLFVANLGCHHDGIVVPINRFQSAP